jgi:hypothetical protein
MPSEGRQGHLYLLLSHKLKQPPTPNPPPATKGYVYKSVFTYTPGAKRMLTEPTHWPAWATRQNNTVHTLV